MSLAKRILPLTAMSAAALGLATSVALAAPAVPLPAPTGPSLAPGQSLPGGTPALSARTQMNMVANQLQTELRRGNNDTKRTVSVEVGIWQSGDDFCNVKLRGVTYGGKPGTLTLGLLGKERIRNFGQHGISFNCLQKNKCISKWKPDQGFVKTIDPKAIWYLDIENRTRTKQLFNDLRGKCEAALEEWHQEQAEAAATPEAQYEEVRSYVRARLKRPERWVLPRYSDGGCKVKRLSHGQLASTVDLSEVQISDNATEKTIHFQCTGSSSCIDNANGSASNTSLVELKSVANTADVLPKMKQLRDMHPACD